MTLVVVGEKIENHSPVKAEPQWLDMSSWDHAPIPERKWAIRDRVPLKQAGLFSGEGGTGKSIIELMKNVAHVAAKDWLGSMPEPGPAFYLGAEDDQEEIHIRLAAIAKHYDVTFKELTDGGLRVLPLLGKDATLCAVTKGGNIEVTALYRQIYEAAGDIKPKNISIDTLSRAFSGNEIDRVQVYAFAMHMQALAMVAEGSVTVLSHPSLSGISSGSGLSGSTAWHGAFRFPAVPQGRQGQRRRAARQRPARAGVQEEPVRSSRRQHRPALSAGPLPARGGRLQPRQGVTHGQGRRGVHGSAAPLWCRGSQRQREQERADLRADGICARGRCQEAGDQKGRPGTGHAGSLQRQQDHGRAVRQTLAASLQACLK